MVINCLENLLFVFVLGLAVCNAVLEQCPKELNRLNCSQNPTNATVFPLVRQVNYWREYSIYRTITGDCNNPFNPSWGKSVKPFLRLLPAQYQDGRSVPIAFFKHILYNGAAKPNGRFVSNNVMTAQFIDESPVHSSLLAFFGQFFAHDFSLQLEQKQTDCNSHPEDTENCYNIQAIINRTELDPTKHLPFERSTACIDSNSQRQAINMVTSFIDASQVYGSTELRMKELREFKGGRLRVNAIRSHRNNDYLPFDDLGNRSVCFQGPENKKYPCFLGGDPRPSEHIVLTTMHTIFLREHNRISRQLNEINREWNDEILFQESRKILIGIMQKIVFEEWMPIIFGEKLSKISPYKGFKPEVNPETADAVGQAVMRFGHGIMVPIVQRRDKNYSLIPGGSEPLSKIFFATEKFLDLGGTDPIIRGIISQPAKEIRGFGLVNSEMTQKLFENHPSGKTLDLGAMNIQRAREHAIPAYKEWRKFCNLKPIHTWDDLKRHIRAAGMVDELERLYKKPENIDLWVAGLIEEPINRNEKLGPTFTCLLMDQFRRQRDGDRFFYENEKIFTPDQLKAIKKYSMSKLICNTADEIAEVPPEVFWLSKNRKSCKSLQDLDFNLWKTKN